MRKVRPSSSKKSRGVVRLVAQDGIKPVLQYTWRKLRINICLSKGRKTALCWKSENRYIPEDIYQSILARAYEDFEKKRSVAGLGVPHQDLMIRPFQFKSPPHLILPPPPRLPQESVQGQLTLSF